MIVKNPSLYLNWLSKSHKGIPNPVLIISNDIPNYDDTPLGCYHEPSTDQKYYYLDCIQDCVDATKGIIILNNLDDMGVLAHEYRHHLQWMKHRSYMESKHYHDIYDFVERGDDYMTAWYKFITYNWCEQDAIRYELKKSQDEYSFHWLRELEKDYGQLGIF